MTRDRVIKILAAIAASVIAGYLVLSRVSLADLKKLPSSLDARYFVLAFVFYLSANYLRAIRFRFLLGRQIGTGALFEAVVTQNFLNTFFPLRAGEVSYLYMVHRTGAVSPGANLASLLGARLLDLVAALLIPLGAMPFTGAWFHPDPAVRWLAGLAVGVAVAVAGVTALGIWQSTRLAAYVEQKASGEGRVARLLRHLADAVRALGQLRSSHVLGRVVFLSFGSWALLYLGSATILKGAGLPVSIADGTFANGFPMLAAMTPLYMFGGFGLFEGSVAFGLTLIGIPMERALSTSIVAHVAELLLIVLPAVPVPLIEIYRGKRRARPEEASPD